jgi:hypothetical protein
VIEGGIGLTLHGVQNKHHDNEHCDKRQLDASKEILELSEIL